MVEQGNYGAQTTADEALAGIDLSDKVAVVTGASGGLGAEVARAFASKGATVILASRDLAKTQLKAEQITEQTGNLNVSAVSLDLADLDSVRAAAENISRDYPQIDILVNNAGLMACEFALTKQGFESQFGVNHVGHFVFTLALIDSLKAAVESRVIVLSSGGHKYATVDLSDPNFERQPYNKWMAYGAAKSANALFAVGLNRRFAAQGVTASAVHPGMIVTDLGRHLTREDIAFIMGRENDGSASVEQGSGRGGASAVKSVAAGAATTVWAATAKQLVGRGGLYLEDCQVASLVADGVQTHGYYAHALDNEMADKLWFLTERLLVDDLIISR